MIDVHDEEVQELVLERIKLSVITAVDKSLMDKATLSVSDQVDWPANNLYFKMMTYVHGMDKEIIEHHAEWPATWWQHFKQRWFPAWLKKRFPVKMERFDIYEPKYGAVFLNVEDYPDKPYTRFERFKP